MEAERFLSPAYMPWYSPLAFSCRGFLAWYLAFMAGNHSQICTFTGECGEVYFKGIILFFKLENTIQKWKKQM